MLFLGMTYIGVRRGRVRLPMASAMFLALVIGLILLPVISVTDDLLAVRQATLPLSGQTWRIAAEDVSVGLDLLLAVAGYLLLLLCWEIATRLPRKDLWDVRPLAGRLARLQRLRPPPSVA